MRPREDATAACAGVQVVYEDLRQPLLEDLYRHSVEQARLGPVLERLDDALGALCEATPKELHAGALSMSSDPQPATEHATHLQYSQDWGGCEVLCAMLRSLSQLLPSMFRLASV